MSNEKGLTEELTSLLNRYSVEQQSNTPDFILAQFLNRCLSAWEHSVMDRDRWYGIEPFPGWKRCKHEN